VVSLDFYKQGFVRSQFLKVEQGTVDLDYALLRPRVRKQIASPLKLAIYVKLINLGISGPPLLIRVSVVERQGS